MSDDTPIHMTATTGRFDVLVLEPADFARADLAELLTTFEVGDKEGNALIPARFNPCPADQCRNHLKVEAKKRAGNPHPGVDCGGGELHRIGSNVSEMTALGLDFDGKTVNEYTHVLASLFRAGLEFYLWETHSHNPPDDCRFRVLLPFDEPMPIKSHQHWSLGAWPALVKALGFDGQAGTDHACIDPARVYYTPRKPTAEATHKAHYQPGRRLNWKEIIGNTLDSFADAADKSRVAPVPPDDSRPVDTDDVRRRLKGVWRNPNTVKLLKRVLKGEAPTPPPSRRPADEPSRYAAWRAVTAALSNVAHDWEGTEALLSVIHPAWLAETADDPSDHTEWDTIEKLFDDARASAPAMRAIAKAKRESANAAMRRLIERRDPGYKPREQNVGTSETSTDVSEQPEGIGPDSDSHAHDTIAVIEVAEVVEGPQVPLDYTPPKEPEPSSDPYAFVAGWTDALQLKPDADGNEAPVGSPANLELYLRFHEDWRGVFRFNALSQDIEVWPNMKGEGPLNFDKAPRKLKDTDGMQVSIWFSRRLDFKLNKTVVLDVIELVAHHCTYDPLVDYLESLEHDGTPRLKGVLRKYFNAQTTNEAGEDITEHVDTIGIKWFVSAIARGLKPGSKVDVVLELEGKQGTGKSTALSILGGQFFSDAAIDIHNKDSYTMAGKRWIIELGELETYRRSEAEAQKAFFSKQFDDYRPPYARNIVTVPRRCVFVGTTNSKDYLTDSTGNRRHWAIACGEIDTEGLRRDRDQLWAEAVVMFKSGVQYHLTKEEAIVAEAQAADRMAPDAIADAILAWFAGKPPERRPTQVTTHEVIVEALSESPVRGIEVRVGRALQHLGFYRMRRNVGGRTTRSYKTPDSLLQVPLKEGPSAASRIASSTVRLVKP